MSVTELIEAAKRRKKCGPDHGLYDMTILADFAARLLLSLDVEAVERAKGGIQNVFANYKDRYRPVGASMLDLYRTDQTTISAAVIAAMVTPMPNTNESGESLAEIKTPVRFDSQFGIVDANDCCLNRDEIVAALNEAAALREEVEGLRRDKARLDACESEAMSTVFHMFSSKEGPVWDHLELTRCGEVFRGKTFREVIDTAIAKENA